MPIKNDWTKKNNNININIEEDKKHSFGILIISICAVIFTYLLYDYIQEQKKEEQAKLNKDLALYNQQVREYNEQLAQQKREIQEYYSTKNFRIKTEYKQNDFVDIYNMGIITTNLAKVKSNNDDNNYKIEIIGNISSYGNLFYKIYKINNDDKYDDKFIEILEELKKIKFKIRNHDSKFKIVIHNNSYDLN